MKTLIYAISVTLFWDCENNHRVNSFYLIIHSATGHFKAKYGEKYLIIDSTEKINGGKELFYEKNYARIGINADNDLPLNKQIKFPTLTIFIRCVVQKGEKLYPQIYLGECLYELVV